MGLLGPLAQLLVFNLELPIKFTVVQLDKPTMNLRNVLSLIQTHVLLTPNVRFHSNFVTEAQTNVLILLILIAEEILIRELLFAVHLLSLLPIVLAQIGSAKLRTDSSVLLTELTVLWTQMVVRTKLPLQAPRRRLPSVTVNVLQAVNVHPDWYAILLPDSQTDSVEIRLVLTPRPIVFVQEHLLQGQLQFVKTLRLTPQFGRLLLQLL